MVPHRRPTGNIPAQVQPGLGRDPHAGDLFVFRGRRCDLVKIRGTTAWVSVWAEEGPRGLQATEVKPI